jgi:teichuronic acid biosynthesis glycosyltransferase TuaG
LAEISIVVPVFNASVYISETLESVISQTFTDWEMWLVDDSSTDNSAELISNFCERDKRFNLIRLKKNSGGPAHPRNVGLSLCTGKYICFLDADDLWPVYKLDFQYRMMLAHKMDFSSGKKSHFFDSSQILSQSSLNDRISPISYKGLLLKNTINLSSVMVKRSVLEGYLFAEDKEYVAVEDYKLWLKLHKANNNLRSFKIETLLLNYRVVPQSISRGKIRQLWKVKNLLSEEIGAKKITILCHLTVYVILGLINEKLVPTVRKKMSEIR